MPFGNPILAGLELVRSAIRSANYAAGIDGWSVNRDGTAEFLSAVIRGSVSAGNLAGGHTTIGSDGALRVYRSDGTLMFEVDTVNDNTTWYRSDGSTWLLQIDDANGLAVYDSGFNTVFQADLSGQIFMPKAEPNGGIFGPAGRRIPYGDLSTGGGFSSITADPTGVTSAVLANISGLSCAVNLTISRVYEITLGFRGVQSTIANDDVQVAIFDGSAVVRDTIIRAPVVSSPRGGIDLTRRFLATASGPKTFTAQMARFAGTGTVTISATATSPAFLWIRDAGG